MVRVLTSLLLTTVLLMAVPAARADGPTVEPLQAPTNPLENAYRRLDTTLRALLAPRSAQPASPQIVGSIWTWQRTEFSDESVLRVPNPANYTVEFMADGTLALRADCNRGFGVYRQNGPQLEIELGGLTRALCPDGSLDQRFLDQLGSVNGVVRDGPRMVLLLPFDSGGMIFQP